MENTKQVAKQQVEDAKRTFLSGENFYAQHLLGAHQVKGRIRFPSLGTQCACCVSRWRFQ